MIAVMFVRLAVNVGVRLNYLEIINNKLDDQYGMAMKDALLLIVASFDHYNMYRNIFNESIGDLIYDNNRRLESCLHKQCLQTNKQCLRFPDICGIFLHSKRLTNQ